MSTPTPALPRLPSILSTLTPDPSRLSQLISTNPSFCSHSSSTTTLISSPSLKPGSLLILFLPLSTLYFLLVIVSFTPLDCKAVEVVLRLFTNPSSGLLTQLLLSSLHLKFNVSHLPSHLHLRLSQS